MIPTPRRLRQGDAEVKVSLGYMGGPYQKEVSCHCFPSWWKNTDFPKHHFLQRAQWPATLVTEMAQLRVNGVPQFQVQLLRTQEEQG